MIKRKHVYIDAEHIIFLVQTKVVPDWVTAIMVAWDVPGKY